MRILAGFCYVAFITDVFSRRIVGWAVSGSLHTAGPPLLALVSTGASRGRQGLVHHSDRGSQYVSLAYSDALITAGVSASVGTVGDSYDNALAEAFNSLFKAELIRNRHKGPWRGIDDLEIAVAEYIDWFNHRRLHGEIGHVPPVEYEAAYWATHTVTSYRENPVPAIAGTN